MPEFAGPIIMDAQTFMAGVTASEETQTVIFEFAAATVQNFVVPRNGHIWGVYCSQAAVYITVNIDPPPAASINGGATKIWAGLVYGDGLNNNNNREIRMSYPVKINDLVRVRGPLGAVCSVVIGYST
jgi:hypothetical protein